MDKKHFCEVIEGNLRELDRYVESLEWLPPSTDAASARQAERFSRVTEAQGRAVDLQTRLDAICASTAPLSAIASTEIEQELAGIQKLLT